MELEVGRNAESVSVNENSDDIVTRLYVEGEYSEYGYVGIDDVNPTGLNFLLNFDYYKEIGVFTQTHQTAVDTYLTNIKDVKDRISANETIIINKETEINDRIGQCIMSLYYVSDGCTEEAYKRRRSICAEKRLDIPRCKDHNNCCCADPDRRLRYREIRHKIRRKHRREGSTG